MSIEAKSNEKGGTVSAKDVGIATVIRHRTKFNCDHAIVIAPSFPTSRGDESALAQSIRDDEEKCRAQERPRTITLINVDDLVQLVRLRPIKHLGLVKLRELFTECNLPQECTEWVRSIGEMTVELPPYGRIIEAVEALQRDFRKASVNYSALRVKLSHLDPPIKYQTDDEVGDLCKAMAQMAPQAVYAYSDRVELDQSAANAIAHIEAALQDEPSNG